jgi:hypothetical protein
MIPQDLINDLEVIKERGRNFETIESDKKIYIFFKDFQLPSDNYSSKTTDLLFFTTPTYPDAGFDMFYTDEKLTLKNGNEPRNATSKVQHLGRTWRQFSYHPYNNKPWNPSEDSVGSFMEYVLQRLRIGD